MGRIKIPEDVQRVMLLLEIYGFEAYVVGGCVRDSILGLKPHDWDICTSATPDEVLAICAERGVKTIETGLRHGTVTAVIDGGSYEITTFRIDGNYSDGRHPDNVVFTSDLHKDLSRRDFTMNAMAYNEVSGLIDLFGGEKDLSAGIIRCVGNADARFKEDALRIMRALRFASRYGFKIDEATSLAIHRNVSLLKNIAAERIHWELCATISGDGALQMLLEYSDVFATIIPELKPCIGFKQNNPYHQYTVYDHIAHAVANYKGNDLSVKVALLLHDIGKPQCYTEDEKGGHFYGHSVPSRDIAGVVLDRLRFDNKTRREVLDLVLYHDSVIEPTPRVVKRWMNKIGSDRLSQLMCIRLADIQAHTEGTQESRIERCNAVKAIMDDIIAEQQCFSLKDLEINGNDIMDLGIPQGKVIGDMLSYLLCEVISGNLDNRREELIQAVIERRGCLQ